MNFKSKLQNKALEKMGKDGMSVISSLEKSMKILEQHMCIIAQNQVEFEKYLKDIIENQQK